MSLCCVMERTELINISNKTEPNPPKKKGNKMRIIQENIILNINYLIFCLFETVLSCGNIKAFILHGLQISWTDSGIRLSK